MNIDKKFLELFRTEIANGIQPLQQEMRSGFADLSAKITETDTRLDKMDTRLDEMDTRLDKMDTRLDNLTNIFYEFREETNARFKQINIRLDACINMTRDFRKDVSIKLDSIGNYLLSLDDARKQHEQRISSLEHRMDHLDAAG